MAAAFWRAGRRSVSVNVSSVRPPGCSWNWSWSETLERRVLFWRGRKTREVCVKPSWVSSLGGKRRGCFRAVLVSSRRNASDATSLYEAALLSHGSDDSDEARVALKVTGSATSWRQVEHFDISSSSDLFGRRISSRFSPPRPKIIFFKLDQCHLFWILSSWEKASPRPRQLFYSCVSFTALSSLAPPGGQDGNTW